MFNTIMKLVERFAMCYLMVAVIDQAVYDLTPWYGLKSQYITWGLALGLMVVRTIIEKLNIEKKEVELI